jgi:hypothetical protein
MNSTSRTPRPQVVERKILRRPSPAKRKPTPTGGGNGHAGPGRGKRARGKSSALDEADRRDIESLQRWIDVLNEGLTDRHAAWISPGTFGGFAGPLGGSKHRQHWEACLKMRRAISHENKLVAALFFAQFARTQHLKVQDIFPSWRFPMLTPFPAAVLMSQPPSEQDKFSRLSELYLAATREQREAIMNAAHAVVGRPISK